MVDLNTDVTLGGTALTTGLRTLGDTEAGIGSAVASVVGGFEVNAVNVIGTQPWASAKVSYVGAFTGIMRRICANGEIDRGKRVSEMEQTRRGRWLIVNGERVEVGCDSNAPVGWPP